MNYHPSGTTINLIIVCFDFTCCTIFPVNKTSNKIHKYQILFITYLKGYLHLHQLVETHLKTKPSLFWCSSPSVLLTVNSIIYNTKLFIPNQIIYSKHYPLIILIRKQQVAELLGNRESRKQKCTSSALGNESSQRVDNQSFFLLVTGLGKMASIMRLRRRFILSEGVSFSSVLFSVLANGSTGLARGERKSISTGGGGSGAAFVLIKEKRNRV